MFIKKNILQPCPLWFSWLEHLVHCRGHRFDFWPGHIPGWGLYRRQPVIVFHINVFHYFSPSPFLSLPLPPKSIKTYHWVRIKNKLILKIILLVHTCGFNFIPLFPDIALDFSFTLKPFLFFKSSPEDIFFIDF